MGHIEVAINISLRQRAKVLFLKKTPPPLFPVSCILFQHPVTFHSPSLPMGPSLIPQLSNPSVCLFSASKIPQAIAAARARTRMTVARGSATSTAACSRLQTTPTPTRPTKSVFTSWKVQQGPLPIRTLHLPLCLCHENG